MARIRKLFCFDIPKIKKMISYLGADEGERFSKNLVLNAIVCAQSLLPLQYKFMPESFIFLEDNEISGLITVQPTPGNWTKLSITQLVLKQNNYEVGRQLVEFVIARYGAKGAASFNVMVDECHDELMQLFLCGCGFRQCSSEVLWKNEGYKSEIKPAHFRRCQNSDAREVCKLHNGEVITHFRPSLLRAKNEFLEPIFAGLSNGYKTRYVLEDNLSDRIIGYLSISTSDNVNFIIDLVTNNGYNVDYDEVISFVDSEISAYKTVYYTFYKQKRYNKNSERFENYLTNHKFALIQTQHILVKDFYQTVKQEEKGLQVFLFGDSVLSN